MKNKKKKILIINDYNYITGGCDKVAIAHKNHFSKENKVFFFSISNNLYNLTPKNFYKNLLNFKVFFALNKIKDNFDLVFIHSWTKQLSSIIFSIKFKKINIVLHDYFLFCPNGGFFNFKKKEICRLKGGSFKCFITNCDKKNYFIKLYRYLRFTIQDIIIHSNKKNIHFIALNNIQEELVRTKFKSNVSILKNKIPDKSFISFSKLKKNNLIIYVGRHDVEKGIDAIKFIDSHFDVITVGGSIKDKLKNITCYDWVKNENDLSSLLNKSRVGIFPSIWFEADPLTPWEMLSKGIPVVASGENLFGQYLKKYIPELVFDNPNELNDILYSLKTDKAYYDIYQKITKLYCLELKKRRFTNENYY